MPTYDYRCKACGHEFELMQSMTDPVKRKCPACAKQQLERLLGIGAGFIIKGGAPSTKAEAA
ncbi:MAG: zinc ribbon domain-containing protein, partial [Phycisphaerales bacterium]|nr:zinc ribbon domain-containing protein [Phycisphaerales bacterium]